ncbi:MAG: hypothetical protein LRY37_05005 [Alkalibacterium thalassium]|nr:hypothetical protein [Alkalibacterium thalassium]
MIHYSKKIIEQVRTKKTPSDKTLLSIMVEEFLVDGFDGDKKILEKMVGDQVELYGTLLATSKTVLHNIKKSVNNAGYRISDLIFQPEAMAGLIMSEDERRFGTIQIDLGGRADFRICVFMTNRLNMQQSFRRVEKTSQKISQLF